MLKINFLSNYSRYFYLIPYKQFILYSTVPKFMFYSSSHDNFGYFVIKRPATFKHYILTNNSPSDVHTLQLP